jgi:hypothetical protein
MLTVVHITADNMLDSLSSAQRRTAVSVTTEHGNYVAFPFNADDLGPIKMWLAQHGWLSGNWNWQANHKATSASTASNALTRKATLGEAHRELRQLRQRSLPHAICGRNDGGV